MTEREMVEQDVQLGQAVYDWFQSTIDDFPDPGCVGHCHYGKRRLMRATLIRARAAEPFEDGTVWYDKLWDVRDYKKERLAAVGEAARLWFASHDRGYPHILFNATERESAQAVVTEHNAELGFAVRREARWSNEALDKAMLERSL